MEHLFPWLLFCVEANLKWYKKKKNPVIQRNSSDFNARDSSPSLYETVFKGDLKVEMMAGGTQITPLNDNVTIFCNIFYSQPLNITSMGITWFWKSLTFDKEVKVFEFFGDHQEAFRPGAIVSPWRLKSGDASLRLPGIQLEEAGEYRCEVVVTPLKAQGTVQLEVVASPASRLFLDQVGVKENEGKYMCESSGFYPEAINITWEKQTQKFPHPIEISEDVITGPTIKNMDGTFNVTSCLKLNSSQEDPGTVYQCVVRHASLHTPLRSNFTLTAARHSLSETEKTDNFSIHWWPISFTGVGLVLLIVLIPWKKVRGSKAKFSPVSWASKKLLEQLLPTLQASRDRPAGKDFVSPPSPSGVGNVGCVPIQFPITEDLAVTCHLTSVWWFVTLG
ncbi:natural cytotoxicity triggering receptor 3 ligand 1 isoform X3 [Pan paniscus]|uniref:natural cytotoxicity triggering receptor 3 ligand 1 isoform X3 n=1 Tax=Pan paniscus TaxID=9597 RepID=UPI0024367D76|nr:natural cytotoxicity triggering receptor 3 ligand 1 isoform X3 [Pan paniscus]XP_054950168.1 natural cytotoxicity triggering receptor 3 ligand 1 isoform X3 [Pan paniscus]